MTITCPHCGFSRETEERRIPSGPVAVTCPSCGGKFSLGLEAPVWPDQPSPEEAPAAEQEGTPSDQPPVRCSACGLQQRPAARCRGCGATFVTAATATQEYVFAGFWIRVVATVIDSILVSILQFFLGLLLTGFVGLVRGPFSDEGELGMTLLGGLFGMTLAVAYYVFFTGYTGQTPGKMLIRVKVIRTDGSAIGYGRAFLREVIGKFISGILLGVGYLMVAFDRRKQGLHDKIADTYVIKI